MNGGDGGGVISPVGITLREFLNRTERDDYIEEYQIIKFYRYGTEELIKLDDKLNDNISIYAVDTLYEIFKLWIRYLWNWTWCIKRNENNRKDFK